MPEKEEIFQKQLKWSNEGLQTLRSLLPLMSPVAKYPWEPEEQQTIAYLASATARTSESALLLCAYGQLWDAEMLVRSVLEGTLKFSYLLQSRDSFATRHREFAHELVAIGELKDHRKAADLLESLPNTHDKEWRPIRDRLLPKDELEKRRAVFGRIKRKDLETRWGFTGLIGELSRSGDPLFKNFGAMAHGYSIASHIQHVDMIGASIALERDLRSDERRQTIHFAHLSRLISDLLWFMFMRLVVGYRFTGTDIAPLAQIEATIKAGTAHFNEAYREWMDVEYPSS